MAQDQTNWDNTTEGQRQRYPNRQPQNQEAERLKSEHGNVGGDPTFDYDEGSKTNHPAIASGQPYRESGKDISQVNPPIVSLNRTSKGMKNDGDWEEKPKIIDDIYDELLTNDPDKAKDDRFPFFDLDVGQGFFVPLKRMQTTDQLVADMNKQIYYVRQLYSEIERNEDGDEIWDHVTIKERKRNADGTIQLHSDNTPIEGANFNHEAKRTYYRNFIAKAVVKGDEISDGFKVEEDGVLVIRVQ